MTIDGYVGRLRQGIEAGKARLDLVNRIKTNLEDTYSSDTSSLNKSRADLYKSQDPVVLKLGDLPDYIAGPLLQKMQDRTMKELEYKLILNGTNQRIATYVRDLYFLKLLDSKTAEEFRTTDTFIDAIDGFLNPPLTKRVGSMVKAVGLFSK